MRWYLVKFQICLLGQLCNFEFLQDIIAFFSKTVWPRNMKFGLQRVSIWVNIKKISSSSVTQYRIKMWCQLVKFQSCLLGRMCNFEFFQVIIAFFSKTMWPRNMKFGLHRVSIWVNIQKKFQVPRSHSIGEKCDANFKISSHFSRRLRNRGTSNLVCIEYPYGLMYKKNFKFLGRTVSEKSAMIFSRYHRIFLKNCVTEEHEIWFA